MWKISLFRQSPSRIHSFRASSSPRDGASAAIWGPSRPAAPPGASLFPHTQLHHRTFTDTMAAIASQQALAAKTSVAGAKLNLKNKAARKTVKAFSARAQAVATKAVRHAADLPPRHLSPERNAPRPPRSRTSSPGRLPGLAAREARSRLRPRRPRRGRDARARGARTETSHARGKIPLREPSRAGGVLIRCRRTRDRAAGAPARGRNATRSRASDARDARRAIATRRRRPRASARPAPASDRPPRARRFASLPSVTSPKKLRESGQRGAQLRKRESGRGCCGRGFFFVFFPPPAPPPGASSFIPMTDAFDLLSPPPPLTPSHAHRAPSSRRASSPARRTRRCSTTPGSTGTPSRR